MRSEWVTKVDEEEQKRGLYSQPLYDFEVVLALFLSVPS